MILFTWKYKLEWVEDRYSYLISHQIVNSEKGSDEVLGEVLVLFLCNN